MRALLRIKALVSCLATWVLLGAAAAQAAPTNRLAASHDPYLLEHSHEKTPGRPKFSHPPRGA